MSPTRPPSRTVGTLIAGAVTGAAAVVALTGLGTPAPLDAYAPESAQVRANLSGSTGATAAAVYVATQRDTRIVLWPGSWRAGNAVAGMPCSTSALPVGATTTKVIYADGNNRKCA